MTFAPTLIHGDCLEAMQTIEAGSVDLVLTDPPYGTTACKWDTVIPFAPMWECLKRVTKKNAAIVLFGSQPFTSALVMSNPKMFRYEWVWDKVIGRGHLVAKKRPMAQHENVTVFYQSAPNYRPQMVKKDRPSIGSKYAISSTDVIFQTKFGGGVVVRRYSYPKTILTFPPRGNFIHPTQKPVALMEYLISTYTNEGETVLDFTMGSGTTGVACKNLNRKFIGIEKDAGYFKIASERIRDHIVQAELVA